MAEHQTTTLALFYRGPFSQWHPSPFAAPTGFPAGTPFSYLSLEEEVKSLPSLEVVRTTPLQDKVAMGWLVYANAEQYMMAEKARFFRDADTEAEIMKTTSPKRVKEMGRQVKGFDEGMWHRVREGVVLRASWFKFGSNPDLARLLVETGDRELVEASPVDRVWGIGLAVSDPRSRNKRMWPEGALNLLGQSLTRVRDLLRSA